MPSFHLTVGKKLGLGFGLVILVMGGVALVYSGSLRFVNARFSSLLDTQVAISSHAARVESLMLQQRRNEKDFLLHHDKSYLKQFEKNGEALVSEVETIDHLAREAGMGEVASLAQEIKADAELYHQRFAAVVAKEEAKGLTPDTGLRGTLRDAVHRLESAFKGEKVGPLRRARGMVILLMARRHEKDYLLRGKPKYVEELHTAVADLRKWISGAGIGRGEAASLTGLLDQYQAGFDHLVAGDKEIASLIAEMRDAVHQIEPAVDKIYESAEAAVASEMAATRAAAHRRATMAITLALAGMVVGLFVAWWIARSVTRPVGEMTRAARCIAEGDLEQEVTHRSTDELGSLAESFRALITYLKEVAAAVEGLGRGDLSVEVAARSDHDLLATSVARTVESLRDMVQGVDDLTEAARAGKLHERCDAGNLSGAYRKTVQGINQTLDAMTAPIEEAARVLDRVAQCDLTVRVEGEYAGDHARIKEAVNGAVGSIAETLATIRAAAGQLDLAAGEIAEGNQDLSRRTEEQAASLEQTAAAMEEMSATTQAATDKAESARERATGARQVAEDGGQVVGRAVSAMAQISTSSEKVREIIEVIDEIAFQTNLLSLNAAVEAVRAGEQGRGFAVVAAEVRNLARRSAHAADEIKGLINDSVAKVATGTELVNTSGERLGGIRESVAEVTGLVEEIATASREQASGIESVNEAVGQMNQITQQNAALVEEVAASADALRSHAREMFSMVERFQLGDLAAGVEENSPVSTVGTVPTPPEATPVTVKNDGDPEGWEDF